MTELDAVAEQLAGHSGAYLTAGRLTAADLSWAAMVSVVLAVQPWEGFGGYLPPVEELPDGFRSVVTTLRAHPAGAFAMRMFRLHRGERQVPGTPALATQPPHDVYARASDGGDKPSGKLGPGVAARSSAASQQAPLK